MEGWDAREGIIKERSKPTENSDTLSFKSNPNNRIFKSESLNQVQCKDKSKSKTVESKVTN